MIKLVFLGSLAPVSIIADLLSDPSVGVLPNSTMNATQLTCDTIMDPTQCVENTELFVHTCVYCKMDGLCHEVGSLFDPCPDHCCASQSSFSSCTYHHPDDIVPQYPGDCTETGNYTNTTAYNPTEAVKFVHYAGAAYCDQNNIMAWSCQPHCVDVDDFAPKLIVTNSSLNLLAFIGYDNTANTIIISFRGTVSTSIVNWIADLTVQQISPFPVYPTAQVHEGFWKSWLALKNPLMTELRSMPKVPIQVTGHSLGGALASLCAFDLVYNEHLNIKNVYTFGQPRVGNFDFSELHKRAIPNNWRLTHAKDLVVHAPPQSSNYWHEILEIFYPGDPPAFKVCDASGEDPTCSNSCGLSCNSVSDHLNYLGFPLGTGC
jgi:hypothetical protein